MTHGWNTGWLVVTHSSWMSQTLVPYLRSQESWGCWSAVVKDARVVGASLPPRPGLEAAAPLRVTGGVASALQVWGRGLTGETFSQVHRLPRSERSAVPGVSCFTRGAGWRLAGLPTCAKHSTHLYRQFFYSIFAVPA